MVKIAILAKGSTLQEYPGKDRYDEVWGLNQLGRTYIVDKLFVMDDLIYRMPTWAGEEFVDFLKTYDKPIITSQAYDDWPTSESFPIEDVAKHFGMPLGISMYSTVDYMLAYAVYIGVKEIDLFGVDCARPGRDETMRVSIGRWIAVAQANGIKVNTRPGSFFQWYTVPGICHERGLYGYNGAPRIENLVDHKLNEMAKPEAA